MIAVHNLAPERAALTLDEELLGGCESIDDLLDGRALAPRADGTLRLALGGYGYRWLRLRPPGQHPRF